MLTLVLKRNGTQDKFDKFRIQSAITEAFYASGEGNKYTAKEVTESVLERLKRTYPYHIPSVENIQDVVEETLMNLQFRRTAKQYILYREKRHQERVS